MTHAKQRNITVDIVRAVAMISIIIGHLGIRSINRVVFTYHVTLFYLIAGFFINEKQPFNSFTFNKIKTLIIPYCLSCTSIIVISAFKAYLQNRPIKASLIWWIMASLYGAGDSYQEPFVIHSIGAIWFLWALFWASLLLRWLITKRPLVRVMAIISVLFVCNWSRQYIWLPLSIQSTGTALLFMYIGYIYKQVKQILSILSKETKLFGTVILLWIWYSFIRDFQGFWLVHGDYGRGIVDIIGSLSASAIICMLCSTLAKNKNCITNSLAYLGQYTIMTLFMHIIELDTVILKMLAQKCTEVFLSESLYLPLLILLKLVWSLGGTLILSKLRLTRRLFGIKS